MNFDLIATLFLYHLRAGRSLDFIMKIERRDLLSGCTRNYLWPSFFNQLFFWLESSPFICHGKWEFRFRAKCCRTFKKLLIPNRTIRNHFFLVVMWSGEIGRMIMSLQSMLRQVIHFLWWILIKRLDPSCSRENIFSERASKKLRWVDSREWLDAGPSISNKWEARGW